MLMETKKEVPTKNLPGWPKAPLPPCKNGDLRGIVWCCKMDKGGCCKRDEYLKKIGMSPEKFVEIKEKFSRDEDWDSNSICWKSLAYCCMRFGHTCHLRDKALKERYSEKLLEEALEEYYSKKKKLAEILMENSGKEESPKKSKTP
jgi:predicted metal-binding transcription factor (methanogenesis marker protein 9)